MLTGEPVPVEKRPGDRVIGGTVNGVRGFFDNPHRYGVYLGEYTSGNTVR